MFEPFSLPLGPVLALLFGALAALLVGIYQRPVWVSVISLLALIGSTLSLLSLRSTAATLTMRPWAPPGFIEGFLAWQVDGWNWFVALLVLLLSSVSLLLSWGEGGRHAGSYHALHLTLSAAAVHFVLSANLLTLLAAWVWLDAMLVVRTAHLPSTRSTIGVAGLSLLGALVVLIALFPSGPQGARLPLEGPTLVTETLILLLLACYLRIGAYPLHFWVAQPTQWAPALRISTHLIPTICGLWLLGRLLGLGGASWLATPIWAPILTTALLGSAVAAWAEPNQERVFGFIIINRATLAVLVAALSHLAGPSALLWSTTGLALAAGSVSAGVAIWRSWAWRFPVLLGSLALWGIPLSPLFLVRGVYDALIQSVALWPIFLLVLIAEGMLLAALLRIWPRAVANPQYPPTGELVRLLAAWAIVALPLLFWGLAPGRLTAATGLDDALAMSRGTTGFAAVWNLPLAGWMSLFLPVALGAALIGLRRQLRSQMWTWQTLNARATNLQWAYALARRSVRWGLGGARQAMLMLDGEGYVGWVLLAGLLLWLLVRA